jgi:hypothetical protein
MLVAAVHLSRPQPVADPAAECGPVSAGDQLSLQWLTRTRADSKLPISDISLGDCASGTRTAVTASVEVGRSEAVQQFFIDRYHCDVKRSCSVSADTADVAAPPTPDPAGSRTPALLLRMPFIAGKGWRLTVTAS